MSRDVLARGNVMPPADRGAFGVTGALTDYGTGMLDAGSSALGYMLDTSLADMGRDAARFGGAMVEGMVEDPLMTAVDFIPGAGLAMGAYEAEQLRGQALEAERAGQFDLAQSLRSQAGAIAAMSMIPGGRTARRGARMDMAEGVSPGQSELRRIIMPGDSGYDVRFSPRGNPNKINKVTGIGISGPEKARLDQARFNYEGSPIATPETSIVDMEGRPFMTTMSDRTAAGYALTGVGDVQFDRPVMLRGGQDFMFDDPDLVWASDPKVVQQMSDVAQELRRSTGQDPYFMPWRMAPTGGDYATMTTDVMFEYANKNMDPKKAAEIDKAIREVGQTITKKDKNDKSYKVFVQAPEWKGIKNPETAAQIRNLSGDQRKMIQDKLDKLGREHGGISLGEARLAVSDPTQYNAPGGGMQNVGLVNALSGVTTSTHPTYGGGLFGEGVGRLKEDVQAYQLLPQAATYRMQPRVNDQGQPIAVMQDPRNPTPNDLRALQMKPYSGIITEQIIRNVLEGGK